MLHDHVHSSTRHAWPKALPFVSAIAFLTLTMFGAIGACTTEVAAPDVCVGGFINDDGVCEGKCKPSKCLPGNICVDNRCVLECE